MSTSSDAGKSGEFRVFFHFPPRQAAATSLVQGLKPRGFVIGPKNKPETLKQALGLPLEKIGESLADECDMGIVKPWAHEELQHNELERLRLLQAVKPILF